MTTDEGDGTTIEPGVQLGDLTLVREIGRGGQGVVYEARQAALNRLVAVKILPKSLASTPQLVARFRREAEAAGRLDHPNVVAVHGFQETAGHYLIVQPLVPGGSLEDRLSRPRPPGDHTSVETLRSAAVLCRDVARGLQHAHEHGVVHRDVKPANILIAADGAPRLGDFGLAKVTDALGLSQTGAVMGTPHYMSPEQVDPSRGEPDARTDVYSLGAVLYRMLTGRVPFPRRDRAAIFADILLRAPPAPRRLEAGVPPDLEAVCLQALEKDPGQRYRSASELADDLDRWLAGQPTMARPLGAVRRAARSLQRLATSSLALLIAFVAVTWLAIDVAWLSPRAATEPRWHELRLLLLSALAGVTGWPAWLLGVRLSRGRRWGGPCAITGVLLAGVVGLAGISGDRTDLLHRIDRAALAAQLEVQRRDVRDIESYVERWREQFVIDDVFLVARLYLRRGRPEAAQLWAERLQSFTSISPVPYVLLASIHEALGDDEQAAAAEAAFAERVGGTSDWKAMLQVGELLGDARRHAEALAAYAQAARLPGAPGALMNLKQAVALHDLCREDEALARLEEHRRFTQELSLEAMLLTLRIARQRADWDEAWAQLDHLERAPGVPVVLALQSRRELLEATGRGNEAWELVRTAAADHARDAAILGSCALWANQDGTDEATKAKAYRDYGDPARAAEHTELAIPRLELARATYTRLAELVPHSAYAQVGLSAVSISEALVRPADAEALLQQAVREAQAGIAESPDWYEGHFNLGLARRYLLKSRHGDKVADWPIDELLGLVSIYRESIARFGLQPRTLNDCAHMLGRVCERTGDRELLPVALVYVDRALRLVESRGETSCTVSGADSEALSVMHDTRRDLLELAGNEASALESAIASLHVLSASSPRRKDREAKIAALRQRLEGGD